jgi:hypothetical protein
LQTIDDLEDGSMHERQLLAVFTAPSLRKMSASIEQLQLESGVPRHEACVHLSRVTFRTAAERWAVSLATQLPLCVLALKKYWSSLRNR